MDIRILSGAAFSVALAFCPALAQSSDTSIPFADGKFTITENADMEKVLSFEGQEITRGYYLEHSQTVEINGVNVALFEVGPGGNACGPRTVLVWKPEYQELQSAVAGDDCGSPSPSFSETEIYFVPYLMPGTTSPVQVWTVEDGLQIAGNMSYVPQPGTTWDQLHAIDLAYPVEAFDNEEVYTEAAKLLGDKLPDVAMGLAVSDGFQQLDSGIVYSYGCVPHACGSLDGFIAVDQANKKLYFAQQNGKGGVDTWPALNEWPTDVHDAMQKSIGG